MRISKRLKIFTLLSTAMILLVSLTLLKHQATQQETYQKLNRIMSLQLEIDKLQSNLWLLKEYGDQSAIDNTLAVQKNITKGLMQIKAGGRQQQLIIKNLTNMNLAIKTLLNLSQNNLVNSELSGVMSTNGMLIARLNTTIQSMGEDIARLQQHEIQNTEIVLANLLKINGLVLIIGTITMTLFALFTMRHFRKSLSALDKGISELAQGDMHSKIPLKYHDEIALISSQFNEMKRKLKSTTINRDTLQQEVDAQTKVLIAQQDKLQYLADHDDLTNTFSRAAFKRYLELAIARCDREQQKACLLFIDLDKFKNINDQYGHCAGDFVLKETASRITGLLRKSDVICRQGGDEFVIWLEPCGNQKEILHVINKLLYILAKDVKYNDSLLPVSVSIGVSQYPKEGQSVEQLLKIADENMYMAKSQKGASYHASHLFDESPSYKQ